MRTFTVYRRNIPEETHDKGQANPPSEPQFEGVVFSDGKVAVRWLTGHRSVSVWDSLDDLIAIHGHPEYGTEIVWHQPTEEQVGIAFRKAEDNEIDLPF
jgi:hypothetical protein